MKADDTTDAPQSRKLILHENSVHQYEVPKEDTTKQSCGCRYIGRRKKCRWGCEEDWILCHAFMRNECSNGSATKCERGYHRRREDELTHEITRPPKQKRKACTCGECFSEEMRKRSLEWREPVFGSHAGEPKTVREKKKAKSESALGLYTSPVTIKSSWSITFNYDRGKRRRQANTSSASTMRRPTRFDEARNSFLGPQDAYKR